MGCLASGGVVSLMSSTNCTKCFAAKGQSEQIVSGSALAAARAAGRPTFTAKSRVSFSTPNVPPWPEHRSTTETVACGMSRKSSGFHGFHVIVGTIFLAVCLLRAMNGAFTSKQHFGFEAAAWYWHFVDVVWLFLFVVIYILGAGAGAGAH